MTKEIELNSAWAMLSQPVTSTLGTEEYQLKHFPGYYAKRNDYTCTICHKEHMKYTDTIRTMVQGVTPVFLCHECAKSLMRWLKVYNVNDN